MPNRPRRSLSADAPSNRTGRSTRSNPRNILPLNDRIDRLARGQSSRMSAREAAESEKAKKKKLAEQQLAMEKELDTAMLISDAESRVDKRVAEFLAAQREEQRRQNVPVTQEVQPPIGVQQPPASPRMHKDQGQGSNIRPSQSTAASVSLPMVAPPIPPEVLPPFRLPSVPPLNKEHPPGSSQTHAALQTNQLLQQLSTESFLEECRVMVQSTVSSLLREYLNTPHTPELQVLASSIADRIWRERLNPSIPGNTFVTLAVQQLWAQRLNPSLPTSPLKNLVRQEVEQALKVYVSDLVPPTGNIQSVVAPGQATTAPPTNQSIPGMGAVQPPEVAATRVAPPPQPIDTPASRGQPSIPSRPDFPYYENTMQYRDGFQSTYIPTAQIPQEASENLPSRVPAGPAEQVLERMHPASKTEAMLEQLLHLMKTSLGVNTPPQEPHGQLKSEVPTEQPQARSEEDAKDAEPPAEDARERSPSRRPDHKGRGRSDSQGGDRSPSRRRHSRRRGRSARNYERRKSRYGGRGNSDGPSDPSSGSSTGSDGESYVGGRRNGSNRRNRRRRRSPSRDREGDGYEGGREEVRMEEETARRYGGGEQLTGKLKVIRPTQELFTKAVDWRSYKLIRSGRKYDLQGRYISVSRLEKEMRVQMGDLTFNGKDPITVLPFLAKFKEACDKNRINEGMAVYCFKKFLSGAPQHLVASRLVGESMATDAQQTDMLTSYSEVVNFLLHTYATEDAMLEAVQDVENCRQSSNMNEQAFADRLWELALRCGTVFSSARLKGYFLLGISPAIRSSVRYHATEHPRIGFQELLAYAKAKGADYRGGRRTINTTADGQPSKTLRPTPTRNLRRPVFALDPIEPTATTPEMTQVGSDELMLLSANSAMPSPPSSLTPTASLTPASSTVGPQPGDNQKLYGTGLCRLCLSAEHTVCPLITDPAVRERLMAVRNANYAARFAQRRQDAGTATRAAPRPTYPAQRTYTARPTLSQRQQPPTAAQVHELTPDDDQAQLAEQLQESGKGNEGQ